MGPAVDVGLIDGHTRLYSLAEFMFKRQKDGERSLGRYRYRDGDTSK